MVRIGNDPDHDPNPVFSSRPDPDQINSGSGQIHPDSGQIHPDPQPGVIHTLFPVSYLQKCLIHLYHVLDFKKTVITSLGRTKNVFGP